MRPGGNPALKTRATRTAFHNTRRVWALLSSLDMGDRNVKTLICLTKLDRHTVYRALHRLHDAGYIDWDQHGSNTWNVVVPFIIIERKD